MSSGALLREWTWGGKDSKRRGPVMGRRWSMRGTISRRDCGPDCRPPRSGQSVADAFVVTWLIALGAETEQKKPI
jgi:hypothetical protein